MTNLTEAAEAVRCPECGAGPTEPCVHVPPKIVTGTAALAAFLEAAYAAGLPMPYSVSAAELSAPHLALWLLEYVEPWRDFLDVKRIELHDDVKQLWLIGEAYDLEVFVVYCQGSMTDQLPPRAYFEHLERDGLVPADEDAEPEPAF